MAMSKWLRPGFLASYRFVRVSRKTGYEVGTVRGIKSKTLSISRDDDSDTKESGSVEYAGKLDFGSDFMRVYLDATYHDGSRETVPLGTFMVSCPSRNADGLVSGGTAELDGRLKAAAEAQYEHPITVSAGSNAVSKAAEVLRSCGLTVVAEASSYKLGAPRTYGADAREDATKLEMVNDLLSLASFRSAWTDGNGTVHLTPLKGPDETAPIWDFTEGVNARFLSQVTEERDISSVKNLVRVTYSTQKKSFVGIAKDESPNSEFSISNLGRVVSVTERLSDVPDDASDQQIQSLANARAREVLESTQSVPRIVKLTTAHCPVWYGDTVRIDYLSASISGAFKVVSMSSNDPHGNMTELTLRRYER